MTVKMSISTLGAKDRALLAILSENAREQTATIARKLGLSRTTVQAKIDRLERDGVIAGYTVRLRPDAVTDEIRAWASVAVEGNQQSVVRALLGEPGVSALHDTNGRWDLLAELQATTTSELSKVLERIRLIKGIRSSETNIHLASYR